LEHVGKFTLCCALHYAGRAANVMSFMLAAGGRVMCVEERTVPLDSKIAAAILQRPLARYERGLI